MSETPEPDSGSSPVIRHSPPEPYDDGRLRVEHENFYVSFDGQALGFRRAEFLLLSRLALGANRVVKADELWRHAWGASGPRRFLTLS
jgi:DNA-binding response OmpR family regulator